MPITMNTGESEIHSRRAATHAQASCAVLRIQNPQPGRLLLIAAHPDDETVGLGASLGRLAASGWDLRIIHVTDGAPRNTELRPTLRSLSREQASALRREEVLAALRIAGLHESHVLEPCLGVADQEAAFMMPALARTIADRLARERFDIVVTHPYEGGHPDHDAVAFAVHAAVQMLSAKPGAALPALAEMSSYHARASGVETAAFLRNGDEVCQLLQVGELTAAERERRRAMLDVMTSQREVLAIFGDDKEPLRCAPLYDFTQAPHPGMLHYERMPFDWKAPRWRELARRALRELALQ